jgi:DNA-binding transcriptional LysR family regulator
MVAAGDFASILPETAVPPELGRLRALEIAHMPPRRLAIVSARDTQLSLADRAVRESVERLVARRASTRPRRGNGRARTKPRAGAAAR